jgi:hypothetical protein
MKVQLWSALLTTYINSFTILARSSVISLLLYVSKIQLNSILMVRVVIFTLNQYGDKGRWSVMQELYFGVKVCCLRSPSIDHCPPLQLIGYWTTRSQYLHTPLSLRPHYLHALNVFMPSLSSHSNYLHRPIIFMLSLSLHIIFTPSLSLCPHYLHNLIIFALSSSSHLH